MTEIKLGLARRALAERAPIVLLLGKRWATSAAVRELDRRTKGALSFEAKRRGFRGEIGSELVVQTHGTVGAPLVAMVGCPDAPTVAQLLAIADRIATLAERESCPRLTVWWPSELDAAALRTVAEGVHLARHRFFEFKSRAPKQLSLSLRFAVERVDAPLRDALREADVRARAVCLARDLANTPAGELSPARLADRAADLAGGDLRVRVLEPAEIEDLRMGALLAVGRGSNNEPRLIEMIYEPRTQSRGHIALVGKGITFDSGGLSLKPANAMEAMKRDMAGGATVIATIGAAAELKIPVRIRGYVPAAENMPSGTAMRPGDVVTAANGRTIEILNTDAEGRLVLADAIAHAVRAEPRAILDFATLTGAVRVALGKRYAAVLGNDRGLIGQCLDAAAAAGEGLWELPLVEEYRADIVSAIADIRNVGGSNPAGTITAALFLSEFVGAVPWAHVDFSSTVMSEGYACHPPGPSGYGVRTALGVLAALAGE